MELRAYQSRIAGVAVQHNTVVVLPTGAGKTLVAAELIRRTMPQSSPADERRAIFLVPTCLLVRQQAEQLRSWTQMTVGEYMGGVAFPSAWNVLVSTPKAFEMAQLRGTAPAWRAFCIVVFDEVHHVLKDHPYRKLALSLRSSGSASSAPRVLGLTASVSYAVEAKKIDASMRRLCDELQVERMETASEAELREGGYHAFGTQAEVLTFDNLPGLVLPGVVEPSARKPHEMAAMFFRRVDRGEATQFACDLMSTVRAMEAEVFAADDTFRSPLHLSVKEWGAYAHERAARHGLPQNLYADLENWYEALRLLLVSWEEAADASLTFLQMTGCFDDHSWPPAVQSLIASLRSAHAAQPFARFEHLKEVLLHKLVSASRPLRAILFVQQKITTHVLEYFLRTESELAEHFRPVCIYSTASAATPSFRVTKTDSKQRLEAFASGQANLLICTSVAEEGMDIPEANCVIGFDPIPNAVCFNQRRGRARQEESSFVILSEQAGRSAETLALAEARQLEVARNFRPAERDSATIAREEAAQRQREHGAQQVLSTGSSQTSVLATLNLYVKKTKATLHEDSRKEGSGWAYTLKYQSPLREVAARGAGESKKAAKLQAASELIARLLLATVS